MIHPRRFKGSAGNITRYYAIGDYYSNGADEHSESGGAIAADLHLDGKVDRVVLRDLLAGRVAGQQLGRRLADGSRQHHPGWDFAVKLALANSPVSSRNGLPPCWETMAGRCGSAFPRGTRERYEIVVPTPDRLAPSANRATPAKCLPDWFPLQ